MPFHSFTPDRDGWKTIEDEVAFANPHLEVHRVKVTSPSRPEPFTWSVCHRKGAVVVAPQTADGSFILVRQERVPIRATLWEFPAGQIDEATEHDETAIRQTGLRELREESGYQLCPDGEVLSLGHFFPSCGFTDEHSHLLLVRPVTMSPEGAKPDENEAIAEARAFTPAELRSMIASGEICDANTLAAVCRLLTTGLIRFD